MIELEIKRRDNDKKVNLLFLEMRNMMSVLLQYKAPLVQDFLSTNASAFF